jgi:hypothetical protein
MGCIQNLRVRLTQTSTFNQNPGLCVPSTHSLQEARLREPAERTIMQYRSKVRSLIKVPCTGLELPATVRRLVAHRSKERRDRQRLCSMRVGGAGMSLVAPKFAVAADRLGL